MDFLTEWWGQVDKISPWEVAYRTAAMFTIMLTLIRFTGMRSFAKGSVFDNVVIILLGSILARGVTGATPFLSALAGGIVLLLIHKMISRLTFYNKWAGRQLKGTPTLLYKEGNFLFDNMKECDITEHDIMEELRLSCQSKNLDGIHEVYMERSGKISFIKNPVST